MIDQVTVFLENSTGHLAALCKALGDAGVSMHALTVADTASYGVVRIIADEPARAYEVLNAQGFRASLTKVYAVEVADEPGGLARLLESLDTADINVEYAYCFSTNANKAVDVLRLSAAEGAEEAIAAAGCRLLTPDELYS
ncbi:MAG: amino acid-binding protein [Actinomycetia bacterium]|nr:amino acid-binding protein [Actinomycetes bacterium]